jgi:hypothetical protein
VHQADYQALLKAVEGWIASPAGAPRETVARLDDVLSRLADQPVRLEDVVSHGSPWGALE